VSVVAFLGGPGGRRRSLGLLHLQRGLCLAAGAHEVGEQLGLLKQELEPLTAASVGNIWGWSFGGSRDRR